MSVRSIKKLLETALLEEGDMVYALYEHELEGIEDDLILSMTSDGDAYTFAVTENRGHVAMLLVDASLDIFVNEAARDKWKSEWREAYTANMKRLIPDFARQLNAGEIPINGVKQVRKKEA